MTVSAVVNDVADRPPGRGWRRLVAALAALSALAIAPLAHAEPGAFGLRGGSSVDGDGERFAAAEVFLRRPLPWVWRAAGGWSVTTHLEGSIAGLKRAGESGTALSAGPVTVWNHRGRRWRFEIGVKPTLLTEDRFGTRELGGHFHFTSHLGIRYDLRPRISLGYRLQHTSNAGISSPNPGLDLQLLTLDLAFH